MSRELPLDWAPAWPPPPQTRLERFFDRLFDRIPWWDQAAVFALFALYLCALCALIVHLA